MPSGLSDAGVVLRGVRERTGSTSVSLWCQLPAFGLARRIHDGSQIHIDFKPVLSPQGATPSLIFLFLYSASYFLMSHCVWGGRRCLCLCVVVAPKQRETWDFGSKWSTAYFKHAHISHSGHDKMTWTDLNTLQVGLKNIVLMMRDATELLFVGVAPLLVSTATPPTNLRVRIP